MSELELEQELQRLLEATRRGTEPDPAARRRVRVALTERLGAAHPAASTAAWSTAPAKFAIVTGVVLACLAGWMWTRSKASAPALERSTPALHPAAVLSVEQPLPTAEAATRATATAPEAAAPATEAPSAAPRPATRTPTAAPAKSEGDSEVRLLAELQLALKNGDPARALRIADEHQRRFPNGVLSLEREAGRTVARCLRAPSISARAALSASFASRYPGSPYFARVEDACSR